VATRKEKVNAGLFLLIGILLLGGTIALVAGLNLRTPGEPYSIRISKSVGGLREGSTVRYLGVPVGRVRSVDFPRDDVETVNVAVEITKPSTPIRTGTYATLASNFLTGETSIELLGGGNDDPPLGPGAIINWRPTSLMRMEDALPGVLDELKKITADVHDLVGEANRSRLLKVIDDLDATVVAVRERVDAAARDLSEMKASLASAGDRIADEAAGLRRDVTASIGSGVADLKSASRSIEGVSGRLTTAADNLAKGTDGLDQLLASLKESSARLERVLGGADALVEDNRDELRQTLASVRQSSRALEELLSSVRNDPSQLLFSRPPPERERESGSSRGRSGGG
jgi:phospholipid/cholesterol/gamma-HCH transport system substrate-binding protein